MKKNKKRRLKTINFISWTVVAAFLCCVQIYVWREVTIFVSPLQMLAPVVLYGGLCSVAALWINELIERKDE